MKAICNGCSKEGLDYQKAVINTEDALLTVLEDGRVFDKKEKGAKILPALFTYGGEQLCFICLALATNVCVNCLDGTDTLYLDKRCKSNPYVCATCVKSEHVNHLNDCYGNGCMSPEELAQEEYEIMMDMEQMRQEYGDMEEPWRLND